MSLHPTALVDEGARLAAGVEIGPYCIVGPDVVLDEGVRLLSHVVVHGHTHIGARTIVHSHAALGGSAQMRKSNPPDMRLEIGCDNVIREAVTISTGSASGHGTTRVGNHCYLMAASHIGHDCAVGDEVTLSNGVQLAGHVQVGEGVIMGGLSAIQQFGRIGRNAFISGVSGVTADVIPYGTVVGTHARLEGLNLVGLRRRGIARENIHALRAAYRMIFEAAAGTIHDNARLAAERWPKIPEVQDVATFILADARRPICPARERGRTSPRVE
ncbi:MAG TPA: acyl-ACP--UDP-N-acetylglucosamine O-acyltransferase [Rhizomicrobium sp.]|jgi:UDP-N-acetylglucosamine acyltransferase